jgi:hypothetical protein
LEFWYSYNPKTANERGYDEFRISIERASNIRNAFIISAGDFNLPGWDWSQNIIKQNYLDHLSYFPNLLSCIMVCSLVFGWISIKRLIRKRDRWYKRKNKSRNSRDEAKFKELKRHTQREIRKPYSILDHH